MQKIIPVTDLQRQAAQILDDVRESDEPVVITQRGRPAAVILSTRQFSQMEDELAMVDEFELERVIREGLEDKVAGKMISLEEAKKRLNYTD